MSQLTPKVNLGNRVVDAQQTFTDQHQDDASQSLKETSHQLTDRDYTQTFEQPPLLIHAHVRPYVVAILLHRGGARFSEVVAAICSQCQTNDLKVGVQDPLDNLYCDGTRLEKIVESVLLEFEKSGLIRYNDKKELWVLIDSNLSTIFSLVTLLDAQIPAHFLRDHYNSRQKSRQ